MKKNFLISLLVFVSVLAGISACNKANDQRALLKVRLTDAPADYQQVLIDIQGIEINASADDTESGWTSLPINAGIYNLLDFRNGMDTLLADVALPAGRISQMRLILGSNNQIKVNEVFYPLSTPSGQQSGLKFNVQVELTEGATYLLWIDFDAARSVVEKGNGTFSLKPVIRTFTQATSGSIKGLISPTAAMPLIQAIANGDTISTIAEADGKYLLRGVPQGSYKVVFKPTANYLEKTIEEVSVTTGVITYMGTITF